MPVQHPLFGFLIRNAPHLRGNPRMAMSYHTLAGFDDARKAVITAEADALLDGLPTQSRTRARGSWAHHDFNITP